MILCKGVKIEIIEKIEELLQTYNDSKYTKLWPVCNTIVNNVIQHNRLITTQVSNYDLYDQIHSK